VPAPAGPLTPIITFSPTTIVAGQPVIFDCRSSTTAAGESITSCQWDFGNGSTANGQTASVTYAAAGTFTVRLTIRDSLDRTATTTIPATVGGGTPTAPLTPVITFSPTSILVGNPVTFDCRSSTTASGATIQSCAWDFGDGGTGSGLTAAHTFTVAGTYTVRVTVTDSLGRTATTTTQAPVGGGTATPLVANFTFSKTDPAPGETVNVNASTSTTAAGATITSYVWDFGGGTPPTGTGVASSTTYSTAGTYTVNLTITDSLGRTASISKTIGVGIPPPPAP
jgi:PKD repeat protein